MLPLILFTLQDCEDSITISPYDLAFCEGERAYVYRDLEVSRLNAFIYNRNLSMLLVIANIQTGGAGGESSVHLSQSDFATEHIFGKNILWIGFHGIVV